MNIPISSTGSQVYVQISSEIAAHLQTLTPSADNGQDVHICGSCKQNFSDIDLFMEHKREGCPSTQQKCYEEMAPQLLRVILEGSEPRRALRSRLLGPEPDGTCGESPADEEDMAARQILRSRLLNQDRDTARREFHIDEEDVATLLANQLASEGVNGASVRPELMSLEDEMNAPHSRDNLSLGTISLSEGEAGPLVEVRALAEAGTLTEAGTLAESSALSEPCVLMKMEQSSSHANKDPTPPEAASPARGKKRHFCRINGCVFTTCYLKDLVRHMRKHTGERPFQCVLCQRSFSRGDKLQTHLRIHSGERPHRCQQCQYATIDSGSLRKHMRIHNDERPYKCQICPYRSRDSSQLTVHLRTHTGDNPFVCLYESCASAFKTSSDLKRHTRMHTGEKPFSCESCEYKCAIKSNLRVHVRLNHTEARSFSCQICKHVASSNRAAREHEKVHAEEVLKCGVCSYSCISPVSMRNHLKVHKQEKPFACKHCPYTCRQQGNLKSHMKKKHPDSRSPKKGKTGKEGTVTNKGSISARTSTSKPAVYSKPFCVKSHQCTFCDAAFVREDSWRSHMRQHQHQTRGESGGTVQQKPGDILSSSAYLIINSDQTTLKDGDSPHLKNECKVIGNNVFVESSLDLKEAKDPEIVQQISQQQVMDGSNLNSHPVFVYVQNTSLGDNMLDESVRSAEILASLNQTAPLVVSSRCGQYVSLSTDQTSLMEQLAAALQPGMQYVLSGPLEGDSVISVHVDKPTTEEGKDS